MNNPDTREPYALPDDSWPPSAFTLPAVRFETHPIMSWVDRAFSRSPLRLNTPTHFSQWFEACIQAMPPPASMATDKETLQVLPQIVDEGLRMLHERGIGEESLFGELRFTHAISSTILAAILIHRVGSALPADGLDPAIEDALMSLDFSIDDDALRSGENEELSYSEKLIALYNRRGKMIGANPSDIIKAWIKNQLGASPSAETTE